MVCGPNKNTIEETTKKLAAAAQLLQNKTTSEHLQSEAYYSNRIILVISHRHRDLLGKRVCALRDRPSVESFALMHKRWVLGVHPVGSKNANSDVVVQKLLNISTAVSGEIMVVQVTKYF